MPPAALSALSALVVLAVTLAGCTGGASIGEACDRHGDCAGTLQCARGMCAPRCQRAPECGDGYACDPDGICKLASGQLGDACKSEVDCAPGMSCQIEVVSPSQIVTRCGAQHLGAPAGAACTGDADCRNGTCALGRCVDLCRATRDCASGTICMQIPHVGADGSPFDGCLLSKGVVSWTIPPPAAPHGEVLIPVPDRAEQVSLVLSTPAPRTTGAVSVVSPMGRTLYRPCPSLLDVTCSEAELRGQFYENPIRHRRELGTAVLAIPSTSVKFETGAYRVRPGAFHPGGTKAPTPAMTALVRIGPAVTLDLHFYFLDLDQHPCAAAFGNAKLDGATAQAAAYFQADFLGGLRTIFQQEGGLDLGAITYEDVARPELDGIELDRVGELLRLGAHAGGVNVFFVRNLSPVGIQAYAPAPGPAGIGGTPRSGIIIGIDTLCYRSWKQLARLTAHELARYMGLYHNLEMSGNPDAIDDSDLSPENLMFYSELGGTALSPGQRDILRRSPVLR